jgi:Bacterial archaeo-eukaryotic release factor family 3
MDQMLREDFEALLADHGGPCVSLFLPVPRPGLEMRQGPVRLRNLLREAQEHLLGQGLLPAEAGALLAPAKNLVEDTAFWQQAGDGLAIFCSTDLFRTFRLPLRFRERVVVGRRFAIKPLLPLTSGHGTFYVLALSQNQVRLFAGREHSVREVELTGVPRSLKEALGDQETTEMLQHHTASPAGRGAQPAIVSGGGTGKESAKVELLRFCRQVDHGLRPFLAGRTAPLVVAGAEPLPTIYREASSYPYLVEDEIPGNPEHRSARELHDLAWPIVGPRFEDARKAAVERFRELIGTGKASADLAEVVPAARGGRVDVLFVAGDDKDASATDEELLEAAAMFTLRNGGTTYEVEAAQVPGGGPVAAVFRY